MAACDNSETARGFKHVKGRPKSDNLPGVAVRLGLYSLLKWSSVVFEPQAPTPWPALQAGAAQQ